jgi:AraC-like DNA-binding protein
MVMRGALLIRGEPDDKWMKCGAALVRPDAFHEVDARDTTVLIGFVDAESDLGGALCERIEHDISCVSENEVARWRAALRDPLSDEGVERWVRTELLHQRRAVKIHPRVNRVIKYVRESLGDSPDFSLDALAALSGLSPSRFMHVFTESVGVPLRPYILWLRVQQAACELMSGANITQAAHTAGFSDAAHLTRTFRRMLGTTPTELTFRKRMSKGVSVQ